MAIHYDIQLVYYHFHTFFFVYLPYFYSFFCYFVTRTFLDDYSYEPLTYADELTPFLASFFSVNT